MVIYVLAQSIPLVVALWENVDYSGTRRLIVSDISNLGAMNFDNKASAIGIHKGPNYDAWKIANGGNEPMVAFYSSINYNLEPLLLTTGAYANIHNQLGFGNVISSIRFNPSNPSSSAPTTSNPAHTIGNIPLKVTLYNNAFFSGYMATVLQDIPDTGQYLGREFHDSVTNIRIEPGPNYQTSSRVDVCEHFNYGGNCYRLGLGSFDIGSNPFDFNDKLDSIRFVNSNTVTGYPTPWVCSTGPSSLCCQYVVPDFGYCRI